MNVRIGPKTKLNTEELMLLNCGVEKTLESPLDCKEIQPVISRQEYWSGLPFPSTGDLPDPGIEPGSPTLQADSLPSEPPEKPLYCTERVNWVRYYSAHKPLQ